MLVAYMVIMFQGEHIGGPMILFLILGLMAEKTVLLTTLLTWIGISGILFTIVKPNQSRDKILIPVCFALMLIPIVQHVHYVINYIKWINVKPFMITASAFFALMCFTLYQTSKGIYH